MDFTFKLKERFIIVGICAVIIDAIVYFILGIFNFYSYETSKKISFVSGAVFAFFFNRNYVFKVKNKNFMQPIMFIFLYFLSFNANSFFHDFVFHIYKSPILSFLLATALSTIINFIGQKFIVFKK